MQQFFDDFLAIREHLLNFKDKRADEFVARLEKFCEDMWKDIYLAPISRDLMRHVNNEVHRFLAACIHDGLPGPLIKVHWRPMYNECKFDMQPDKKHWSAYMFGEDKSCDSNML
jgi:hypothetical protein